VSQQERASAELKTAREHLQAEILSLSAELSDAQNQLQQLSDAKAALESELQAVKEFSSSTHSTEESEALSAQVLAYQQEIQTLKDQLSAAQEKAQGDSWDSWDSEETKLQLETVLTEKKDLEVSFQALRDEKALLDSQLQQSKLDHNRISQELHHQLQLLAQKEEEVLRLQADQESVNSRLSHLLKQLEQVSQQKEQLEVDNDSLRGEIEGMEKIIAEAQFTEQESQEDRKRLGYCYLEWDEFIEH